MDFRLLQDTAEDSQPRDGNDSKVLRNTLRVYGLLLLALMLLFCYVRRKYPKTYNLRSYLQDWKTRLATDQYGNFSWAWKVFFFTESEILDECGVDALCYIRALEFGTKLSVFGMINAIWLMPIYATAKNSPETDYITDSIVELTAAHLPSKSYRFLATVVAAYLIFGYTMYSILKEFSWFIRVRHTFLTKKLTRNYSVYVQNIPPEYQTNDKLLKFFSESSGADSVLEARVAIQIPNLQKMVKEREKIVAKLEHAINVEEIKGVTPTERPHLVGERQNLIDSTFHELRDLNEKISEAIDNVENSRAFESETGDTKNSMKRLPGYESTVVGSGSADEPTEEPTENQDETESDPNTFMDALATEARGKTNEINEFLSVPTQGLKDFAQTAKEKATNLISDSEDGEPYSAGFVTFKTLRATQSSLQMIQYPEPFAMEVLEAPDPEDVLWKNIGKDHKELQIGKLLSLVFTAALCLFWTIPISFISTLASIDGLSNIKFIANALDRSPWLEPFFAQLAPLLIVAANALLKVILRYLSLLEGPISGAVLQASLFVKLSSFIIIQTFFVASISGTIFSTLSELINQPGLIIDLLANSLPAQSTFFIQIILVDTCFSMGLELLRVIPVAMAYLRSKMGPNLTEKERNTTWCGLRPLTDPSYFGHASVLSGTVLYFMVFFVYSTIAPITTFFIAFCFSIMSAGYRHQFIYIYPTFPDSGGKLWVKFIGTITVCMIIAQLTIIGQIALKKQTVSSALMIPLIVITILFSLYIRQKHFEMTEHLPSHDCMIADYNNRIDGGMDHSFLRKKYIQPELLDKEVYPCNISVECEIEHGCLVYHTPKGSYRGNGDGENRISV